MRWEILKRQLPGEVLGVREEEEGVENLLFSFA